MEEHSEYSFRNNLMSNIKYWLLGSFISFSIGWTILVFFTLWMILSLILWNNHNIHPYYIYLWFSPFIGAVIIKLINKELPCYVYSITGICFIIIYCCNIDSIVVFFFNIAYFGTYVNLAKISNLATRMALDDTLTFYTDIVCGHYSYGVLNYQFVCNIIASFLGGFIVDIYRYFKGRNSERNYL